MPPKQLAIKYTMMVIETSPLLIYKINTNRVIVCMSSAYNDTKA